MTEKKEDSTPYDINWPLVFLYIHLHAGGLYGLYLLLWKAKLMTLLFAIFVMELTSLGITIGAHRFWAHRTYTTTWHVRLFFVLAHTLAAAGPIYNWVVAHRIHHKHQDTEKDPYNHKEGFLYSHFISNIVAPHPEYEKLAKEIDLRDIEEDVLLLLQRKLYWLLFAVLLYITVYVPIIYWNESLYNSLFIMGFTVTAISLNISWLVNSAKHIWGMKPGDKYPVDDNSVFFVTKTYWLNYHYLLPWDWKTGEFGTYDSGFNTFVLKLLTLMDLVSGLKTTSSEDIREALYQTVTSEVTMKEVLQNLEELSEQEAETSKLKFQH